MGSIEMELTGEIGMRNASPKPKTLVLLPRTLEKGDRAVNVYIRAHSTLTKK